MGKKTAILSLIKNETQDLENWLEYHYSLGFDLIYLFEDYGSDSHYDQCMRFGEDKIRLLQLSKFRAPKSNDTTAIRQIELLNFFIENNPEQCDWVLFIDIDEYLVFNDGYNLEKLTTEFETYPAVHIYWKTFGANGHLHRQQNAITAYTQESPMNPDSEKLYYQHKSLINLSMKPTLVDQHSVVGGVTTTKVVSRCDYDKTYAKAQLNHYFTKSWEDWKERIFTRGDLRPGNRKLSDFFDYNPDMLDIKDELISECIGKKPSGDVWLDRASLLYTGKRIADYRERDYIDRVKTVVGDSQADAYVKMMSYRTPQKSAKIALVYFTYDADEKFLDVSLTTSSHLADEYPNIDIYVVDDANHPMSKIPTGVTYLRTSFDRKTNLNGKDSILGIVDVFNQINEGNDYDWIVKSDPDTIINSLDLIAIASPDEFCNAGCGDYRTKTSEYGLISGIPVFGCLHGISRRGLRNINDCISQHSIDWDKGIRLQQDLYLAKLACKSDPTLNFYTYNFMDNPLKSPDKGVYFDFEIDVFSNYDPNVDRSHLLNYSAITFKSLTYFDIRAKRAVKHDEKLDLQLQRMTDYANWLMTMGRLTQ